jgi:hypothetical protein
VSSERQLEVRARELFVAARNEGPDAGTRESARAAVLEAYDRREEGDHADEMDEPHAELGDSSARDRRVRSAWWLPAAAATLAIAAGWAIVTMSKTDRDNSIGPAPERISDVTKKQAVEPTRSAPVAQPEQRVAPPPRMIPSAKSSASAPTPPTLTDEVGMLDRARSELREKGPARALELLDDYDRRAGTHLRDEATLLRIEALARVGRGDEASALAKRFIESNPSSTLADRARSYVTSTEQKGAPQ